ncbi:MAG: zinc protease, partial [Myxococcota bacterium]
MPLPDFPPQGGPPAPWKVPTMVSRTLPSGLRIVVARLPWLPVVHIRWALRGGRLLEAPGKTGSAGLLGTVARHGTARYDSAGLASALDHLGASLRISVGLDSTSAGISGLSEHTDTLLDLVDEALLRPTFPEAHLTRERDNALQVHRHQRAQPSVIAGGWLARSLYGDHPYGHPAVISEELASLTADDLRELHARILAPQRGQVLVVGDVDAEATADALAARYADLPVGVSLPEPPPKTLRRRLIAIERPSAEQVVILFGLPLFSWGAPDHL